MTTFSVPLLPGQAAFLNELAPAMLDPARWSLPIICDINADVPPQRIEEAIAVLWRSHPALRARFHQTTAGSWIQTISEPSTPAPLRSIDVSQLPASSRAKELANLLDDLYGMLDLSGGPLARFVLVRRAGEPSRLLAVLHHLTCDLLSLRILGLDLEALLGPSGLTPISKSRSGAEYHACATAMHQYAQSQTMASEATAWKSLAWHRAVELPKDYPPPGRDHLRGWTTTEIQLPANMASDLVRALVKPAGADLSEIILAAVSQVLTDWSGGAIGLRVVHHGRSLTWHATEGGDDLPVLPASAARTVGWLSSEGMVLIPPREPKDESDHACYVAKVRRATRLMPNHGLGISLLRWDPPPDCDRMIIGQIWKTAQVRFNFLGGTSRTEPDAGPLRLVPTPPRVRKDPLEPRLPLHVRAMLSGAQLRIMWDYDPFQFREETMVRVAERCRETLLSYTTG